MVARRSWCGASTGRRPRRRSKRGCGPARNSGAGRAADAVGHPRTALSGQIALRELGTLGGAISQAKAVNRLGHVVGTSRDSLGRSRAFIWKNGAGIVDLSPFTGVNTSANDINDAGDIVGGGDTGFGDFHAYLLSEGTSFDLGTLGGIDSEALALNRSGQVAGHSRVRGGSARHAFFLPEPGRMADLGSLGGATSIAHDVNDRGEVVGFAETATGQAHAVLWTDEAGMVDLGTLGGVTSCANDVNDAGCIVGVSQTAETDRRGQPATRAFLRTPDGRLLDLGTLGGEHSSAAAIAEEVDGTLLIVGHSHDDAARVRAVLWIVRLVPPAAPGAPAPGSTAS